MKRQLFGSFFAMGALAAVAALSSGCVSDRPSRNGVFNENQYVRKDFIIRAGDGSTTDTGWILQGTVTQTSSPNPLGGQFGLYPGATSGGFTGAAQLVRFVVTQDKLQMVDMREFDTTASETRIPSVVNAWPITNVDLKYRVNLDGETTNFYEENQELDWQVRQWVKVNFDKNDLSDIAPMGSYVSEMVANCTDIGNASATLVPNSFLVDEPNDYMEWQVNVTLPLKWDDATCVQMYGPMGQTAASIGRQTVSLNLKYSMVRAKAPSQISYTPMLLQEKDPIQHKYGVFTFLQEDRNNTTNATDLSDSSQGIGNLAVNALVERWDPRRTEPVVWYFSPDFPQQYKHFFTDPNGIKAQTNQLMKDAGASLTFDFQDWDSDPANPKQFGDVRYSFLRWMTDEDMQDTFAGVTTWNTDPRTGETLSGQITFNDFAFQDYYIQRINAYLQTIGSTSDINSMGAWPTSPQVQAPDPNNPGQFITTSPACNASTVGQSVPIVSSQVASANSTSTVYGKMQAYLNEPVSVYGNLSPTDFIQPQDPDFFRAYYTLLPYEVFADPAMNAYVIPEGGGGVYGPTASTMWTMNQQETQFQQLAASIDQGIAPYQADTGTTGVVAATSFLNNFRDMTINHSQLNYMKGFTLNGQRMDTPDAFSFVEVMAQDGRRCIANADGTYAWETKEQWVEELTQAYWGQVLWHEFGHSMGLEHNFMASIDKNNFPVVLDSNNQPVLDAQGNPTYGLHASSIMEYNAAPDRVAYQSPGWAPYDQGAISFIYANSGSPTVAANTAAISGQVDANTPWKDPHGFNTDGSEIQYLFCSHQHLKYTPFCREGDMGTTPSEIIANALQNYEWQYQWRNFRVYRKIWDDSAYANTPAALIPDLRKFISLGVFDWSSGEISDSLRRIGFKNPDPNGSDQDYFNALGAKFQSELSAANSMVAAFHKAIIQQASGERPYRTVYDTYYGDVTQQGIILDKLFAMQGWVGLWPTDNYDQNQAGSYIASYSYAGDTRFNDTAEDTLTSMIGGQYDVYPYFVPLAVAQFAQDTHSPSFSGRIEIRDWIGGQVFSNDEFFLDYFRQLAATNNYPGCPTVDSCTYDPRTPANSDSFNQFVGPDQRHWIWAYIPDRNQYVAVQKERNVASFVIVYNYNTDVVNMADDGSFPGAAYSDELPMKYFLDSFNTYN